MKLNILSDLHLGLGALKLPRNEADAVMFDIIRGYPWPPIYTGRAIRNGFVERWHGRENHLANVLETERVGYRAAAADGDFETAVVWPARRST